MLSRVGPVVRSVADEAIAASAADSPGGSRWTADEVDEVCDEVADGCKALVREALTAVLGRRGLLADPDDV